VSSTLAGEAACLTAALLWAVSLAVFRSSIAAHGARTINLAKCLLAAVLQGVTVLFLGQAGSLTSASARDLVLLAASGLIGLTLGDTALFVAVTRIGLHRTLLLQTLSPVFAAILAALWQGERPTTLQAVGAAVVLAGVGVVVAPSGARRAGGNGISGKPVSRTEAGGWAAGGVLLAVLAAFGQGSGLVLAKVGMAEIPVVAASFFRLAAAAIGLALVGAAVGRLRGLVAVARSPADLARVVPATFFGTYLALFAMMAGVALAPASVAAVLLSTSPLFSLLIERVVDGKPVTVRGLVGTLLAVAGVAVLVNG
jgi:drug/metabolite transporter (DMT)-like permease